MISKTMISYLNPAKMATHINSTSDTRTGCSKLNHISRQRHKMRKFSCSIFHQLYYATLFLLLANQFILFRLVTSYVFEVSHEQQQQHFSSSAHQPTTSHTSRVLENGCPKGTWTRLGTKCYKLSYTGKTYDEARNRCKNLSGSRMAIIDDESMKERESDPPNAFDQFTDTVLTELKNMSRTTVQVAVSDELMSQYNERVRSANGGHDFDASDLTHTESILWLPQDDPILTNLTPPPNATDNGFILAFSKTLNRWGLSASRKNLKEAYICERNAVTQSTPNQAEQTNQHAQATTPSTITSASNQQQNIEPKRAQQNQPAQPPPQSRPSELSESFNKPPSEATSLLFREMPQDQSVMLGSTTELRCSPLEKDATLTWSFNGKNLNQSTQHGRVKILSSGTLRIEHVRNTDDGNYVCTVRSGSTTESKSVRVEIIELPHQPEYIQAELIDKLSTSVRVKWTPGFNGNSPIVKYLVEMRTVTSENMDDVGSIMLSDSWEMAKANISADQTSVIVPDLKPAKKYIFRVKAVNRVGPGEPSFPTRDPIEVPVQPPSMPPENLMGTPRSSTSIAIQWSPPPADSQNGDIRGYKVRHRLAGYQSESDWYSSDIVDTTHLVYVLDGLIEWQKYEIQIAAENDKGVGPWTPSSFVRTKEGKPVKPPRNVRAESTSATAVKISWTQPPQQYINGINQGYRIQLWYNARLSELARESTVSHNTVSPLQTTSMDNLLPYTEYYVTVKCFTSAGDGVPNENPVLIRTKQAAPEAVPVLEFADVLDKSLRVLWKPPKRINGELDHYTLEYSEVSAQEKTIVKNCPPNINETRIYDLTPQTGYIFKIYAYTEAGRGPEKTNQTTTTMPPVLPEPPSNLVPTNIGPYSAVINFEPGFNGNANIEKWNVEAQTPSRADYTARWQNIYVSTNHSQGNSVEVRNLRPFTRYKIRLTPVNVAGVSRYPSEPTPEFQTAQTEPEQPPRDLSLEEVKTNSISVRWLPLSNNLWLGNPRGYNLTWTDGDNSSIRHHMIYNIRADSCLIKDLEEYTEYTIRIYAVNEAGSSPASEPITAMTHEDVPSASPSNISARASSSSSIVIEWGSVPRRHMNGLIKGYRIQYQALKPDAPILNKTVDDNSTKSIVISDLKPFTAYHLALAAFTGAGDGVYSSVITVQTLEDTPGKPQNFTSPTLSQTAARLLWDPPEDPNGDIVGYKVSYHPLTEGNKEILSQELHQNERTFKAINLKPDTHYLFTVTAKTKEGWGQQNSLVLYTHDSELRANLPFFKESWFVILCACLSIVITIIVTALLFIQTKSYKYKQEAIKSTSQDRLGDAGFTIDDEPVAHSNNGFGLLSNEAHYKRSNGALSQSTANFTLPKTPPRPQPGSIVYSDDGDDDVFEEMADKPHKNNVGTSNYDSSGDSLTEKPSEFSNSPAPESESCDDEYVNMANKHFVNHYANVNGTLRGQKSWKRNAKQYSSSLRTTPKLPQRPAPSVPHIPSDHSQSSSDHANQPMPGTSGMQNIKQINPVYTELPRDVADGLNHQSARSQSNYRSVNNIDKLKIDDESNNGHSNNSDVNNNNEGELDQNNHQVDLLSNNHIVNLNGGRIIVDNMAGSRAPLPGFTSFV